MATVVHARDVALQAVTPRTAATSIETSIAAVAAAAAAAQGTANTALTNAATAQSTANAASASGAAANAALTNLASDNILSPLEKPAVVLQYTTIINEQAGIDASATAYGITTQKTNYDNAVTALTSYLGTLSGWNTIPGSDVVIVGTTFRTNFGNVYSTRQILLNRIAEVAQTLANNAQATANTAVANAATAQATANAASTAAGIANTALSNLASDNIISPSEKPPLVLQYNVITTEQAGIDARATAYGITTEKTAYDNAVAALTAYLGTLSGWNTIPGSDVAIVGTTFRTNWANVYSTRQTLLNKIAEVAGTLAVWAGVSGANRPADNATSNNRFIATAGITLTGNTAVKVSGTTSYDAQVYSPESFTGGAIASVVLATNYTGGAVFGLNTDPTTDANYTSIDYGLAMALGGSLDVYENGVGTAISTWAAGDTLAIIYDNINIYYIKNGTVLRTRTASAQGLRFHFDSSFSTLNTNTLTNIQFGPFAGTPAELSISLPGSYTRSSNNITKSTGTSGWNDSAHSASSYSGGAMVEARNGTGSAWMIGLTTTPSTVGSYPGITYAFYASGTSWAVYTSGVSVATGSTDITATLAVSYDGSTVRFLTNGVEVFSIPANPGLRLYAQIAIHTVGLTVGNIRFLALSNNYYQRSGNMVDSSWWNTAVAPSTVWPTNSGNNIFVPASLPDGSEGIVWRAEATGTEAGGGWQTATSPTNNFPVDKTKTYMFVCYTKGVSGSGVEYFGTSGVDNLNTTTLQGNPYFASTPKENGVWHLHVGMVYPNGSTGHTNSISGTYKCTTGEKITVGTSYNWNTSTRYGSIRAYQFYQTIGAQQYFAWPAVYLCDGSEPSLDDLLSMASTTARNPITQANVNNYVANDAIVSTKLLVTGRGRAINDDPGCVDTSAWITTAGSIQFITDTNAPYGSRVIRATNGTRFQTRNYNVSPNKVYKVSMWARQISGGGAMYLRMYTYNNVNTLLTYTVADQTITPPTIVYFEGVSLPSGWTKYTGFIITPAGSGYANITVHGNWNTTGVSDYTDIRCEEYVGSDLIVDGSVTTRHMTTNGLIVRKTDGTIILSADATTLPWVSASELVDSTTGISLLYPWNPATNTRILRNMDNGDGIQLELDTTNVNDQFVKISSLSSEVLNIRTHIDRNSISTTMSDITGMLFTLSEFQTYTIKGAIKYVSNSTANGIALGITTPANSIVTMLGWTSVNASGGCESRVIDLPTGGSGSMIFSGSHSTTASSLLCFEALIIVGATPGTFQLRYASEVGGSQIIIKQGSNMTLSTRKLATTSVVVSLVGAPTFATEYRSSRFVITGGAASATVQLQMLKNGTYSITQTVGASNSGTPLSGNWANPLDADAGEQWQIKFVITGPVTTTSIGTGGTVSHGNTCPDWTTLNTTQFASITSSVPNAIKYRDAYIDVEIRMRRLDSPATEYSLDTVRLSASATSEM